MRLVLATTALVGSLSGLPMVARAQTAGAQASASTDKANTLSEVIVTAEKRDTTIARTPLAVTAYTGQTLKDQGIVNVSDLQNVSPSVVVGRDNFGVNIAIRGVTTTDNTSKGDEGISFNVDGIPYGRPVEEGLAFFDVARVEVLRGPQGTLYGKSSTGGALNVITNRPQDTFQASADGEISNYNTHREDFTVNVPINDQLAVRFAANANEADGYLTPALGAYKTGPAVNGQDDVSGRGSLLYKFQSDGTLFVAVTGGHVGGTGAGQALLDKVFTTSGASQREIYGSPFASSINDSFLNVNAEFNKDLGYVHLAYDGAHLSFQQHDMTNSGNNPLANNGGQYGWRDYHGNFQTDSHEVRLSNKTPGRIDWVVGANWYRENIHESDHNWGAPFVNPTYADSTNGIDPVNNTIHTTYGVFGQGTLHLNDVFGLVLGLREGHDALTRVGTFAAGPFDAHGKLCAPFADCIGGPNNGSESASKLTYRVGLNAQFTPTQLVYASVATGYKAGGFNDFDPATHGAGPYAPESLTAYELGYKGRILPNLQLNSALYYYDYASEQISSLENIMGNFVIFTKGTPTTLYGWENEMNFRLDDNNTFDGSLSMEKSRYSNFRAGINANVNWSGQSLDRTPAAVISAGYNHYWSLGDKGSVKFRIDTRYSSSYLISDFVSAIHYTQSAFTRSDASLTYTSADQRFTAEAFARNLEDNIQATGGGGGFTPGVPNAATVAVNTPRQFGLRLGYKY
ncbi:MAG TPA: TonB-dependent receptor [Caulobacteraceae bacterium]|nr:TonB-dependent receptor [Caulobacteraceae bacterium]